MFDSNTRINSKDYQSSLKKLSNELFKFKVDKALCILCSKSKKFDVKNFLKNTNQYKNIFPVIELRKKDCNFKRLEYLKKIGVRSVKIHPRHLCLDFRRKKFYKSLFKILSKFKFLVLWCTLDSWPNYHSSSEDQINLISEILNQNQKISILLMHGGGTNLLKYYEKFRFRKNLYLDLSYTINKFKDTTVNKDIVYLLKNFDKRIIIGTDYPDISFKEHYLNLKLFLKKNRIPLKKSKNFLNLNLINIVNET